jgi:hypothetical protein
VLGIASIDALKDGVRDTLKRAQDAIAVEVETAKAAQDRTDFVLTN